jgi:DNA-binding GntR family transcriptional regulator
MDDVAERLRELILGGTLLPGQQLLQTQLGVSRTPLREAFRLRERDGLIRTSNGNNTVEVVELTNDEIEELYDLCMVLDGLAARCVAETGMDDALSAEISTALADMAGAAVPRYQQRGSRRAFPGLL